MWASARRPPDDAGAAAGRDRPRARAAPRRRLRRGLRGGAHGVRAEPRRRQGRAPAGWTGARASVRVVQGDATYFGYVDGVAEDDLVRVADSVAQALRGDARAPGTIAAPEPALTTPVGRRPEEVEAAAKADVLRACDEAARAAGGDVAQVRIGYSEARRRVTVYGSDGRAASDDHRVRLGAGWWPMAGAWRRAPTRSAGTQAGAPRAGPRRWRTRLARRSPCWTPATRLPAGCRWWWGRLRRGAAPRGRGPARGGRRPEARQRLRGQARRSSRSRS